MFEFIKYTNTISTKNILNSIRVKYSHTNLYNYKFGIIDNNNINDILIANRIYQNKILSTYGFGVFNKINKNILNDIQKMIWLNQNQYNKLYLLTKSISKMCSHSAIYKKDGQNIDFVIKTSKDKPYNYFKDNDIKEGGVIRIIENSYLSNVKYRSKLLTEKEILDSNSIFKSIKKDEAWMVRYGYNIDDIKLLKYQIHIFNNINNKTDISNLTLYNYSIIKVLYHMVYTNYINKQINEEQWLLFLDYYKNKLEELKIKPEDEL